VGPRTGKGAVAKTQNPFNGPALYTMELAYFFFSGWDEHLQFISFINR